MVVPRDSSLLPTNSHTLIDVELFRVGSIQFLPIPGEQRTIHAVVVVRADIPVHHQPVANHKHSPVAQCLHTALLAGASVYAATADADHDHPEVLFVQIDPIVPEPISDVSFSLGREAIVACKCAVLQSSRSHVPSPVSSNTHAGQHSAFGSTQCAGGSGFSVTTVLCADPIDAQPPVPTPKSLTLV